MLRKYLLCLLAVCAVSNAQSTPPAQQTQSGRGGRAAAAVTADANDEANANANGGRGQTMKQLARGTLYAAASMSPQATLAAEHMLRDGGNAFDAIVAGQAVLGLVQPNMNGMGSDATLLIYDAKAKKVWSLNAEGTAPKLATIEWYKTHQDGKIPVNDSLLSATVPGVMDAWYIMLSKWGTKSFAEVLAPAIEHGRARRAHRRTRHEFGGAAEISHQHEALRAARRQDAGTMAKSGRIPTWRAPCGALVEAEKAGIRRRDAWPG